jgi:hypothetical protein
MAGEEFNNNNNTFKSYAEVIPGWTVWGSNTSRGKRFYFLQNVQTGYGTHSDSYPMGTSILSPW